jgi:hypothetical protein
VLGRLHGDDDSRRRLEQEERDIHRHCISIGCHGARHARQWRRPSHGCAEAMKVAPPTKPEQRPRGVSYTSRRLCRPPCRYDRLSITFCRRRYSFLVSLALAVRGHEWKADMSDCCLGHHIFWTTFRSGMSRSSPAFVWVDPMGQFLLQVCLDLPLGLEFFVLLFTRTDSDRLGPFRWHNWICPKPKLSQARRGKQCFFVTHLHGEDLLTI